MMKEITVWECEYCKKLFKTPDKHKCKFSPELKNCFTCKNFKDWIDAEYSNCGFEPAMPDCDKVKFGTWSIETIKELDYNMNCTGYEKKDN